MTPATKEKAHAKLAQFTTKIGYPDKWRDWSTLEVRRDDLIGNEMRAAGGACSIAASPSSAGRSTTPSG